MDNAGYTSLGRQSGLLREMQLVANNIANISTNGFRKEGLVFAEYVHAMDGSDPSLSMAHANVRATNMAQGPMTQTTNPFDLAIEGPGFFLVETPNGNRLTRAGNFTPNSEGELVTADGYRVLDIGSAPVFVPPDASSIAIASDGTVSTGGRPLAQIGVFEPANPAKFIRAGSTMFEAEGDLNPVSNAQILQGFLEDSNVNPVLEIARMIEVQHAYELGQKLLDQEDDRIRSVMQTLSR
ncbi:MAG: flagellar hook-basal body complex protein [Marinosulfonomonas sp.]|nr:flagellar hook-basal body complex protein [Marinosulfonomonas sp.]